MKAHLMYLDRDFDLQAALPPNAAALIADLELDTLFAAMAADDPVLLEVARRALLISLDQPEAIRYRQEILADCLAYPAAIRELYDLAVEALAREKRIWGPMRSRYPEITLHRAVELLTVLIDLLARLRRFADAHRPDFRSPALTTLCEMLSRELDDAYLATVGDHLRRLEFRAGVLLSAELGEANKGTHYVLRKPLIKEQSWRERLQSWVEHMTTRDRSSYTYEVADRDEAGFAALSELRSRGIAAVASTVGPSAEHVLGFFRMLRVELAFYVGCLNLRDRLAAKGEPSCEPEAMPADSTMLSARGLYDIALSLKMNERAVGNDVNAEEKRLVVITGANRGGKSTLLRAFGQAQLMMQCGLFVPAGSFRANICDRIFTHYKREEDPTMKSGKLDEELARMSDIIDRLGRHSIVLLNESFASTNEREGSEIARQVVRALLESGIKVLYVTHLFELAHGMYLAKIDTALFLCAERGADGRRTFRILEGAPLPTSHGEDLYRRIFGGDPTPEPLPTRVRRADSST